MGIVNPKFSTKFSTKFGVLTALAVVAGTVILMAIVLPIEAAKEIWRRGK